MVVGGLLGALCFFLDFFKTTVVGAAATPESRIAIITLLLPLPRSQAAGAAILGRCHA